MNDVVRGALVRDGARKVDGDEIDAMVAGESDERERER